LIDLSHTVRAGALGVALTLGSPGAAGSQELPFLDYARIDPRDVMTAESCGECHSLEHEVWKKTPHSTSFKTLHRKPQAEQIAGKLGFRLIKRQSFCYSCHYTPVVDDDAIRVVSGVSCESCHGASRRWIDVHNNYGDAPDHRSESAQHRQQRIDQSREAGMRRPSDLYPVVANCFGCHTVPNERLVNVGGHTTGSSGFEFVEWSQGQIRHNFLRSSLAGGEPQNVTRPMSQRRPMYVVGRALDLEYSLRGMAIATDGGVYSKAMTRRVRSALSEVRAIASVSSLPEVDEMVAAVRGVRVAPGNEAELLAAAEQVGAATRRFLQRGEGAQLAGLDPLILGTAPPAEAEPAAVAGVVADAQPEGAREGAAAGAGGGAATPESGAARTQASSGQSPEQARAATPTPSAARSGGQASTPASGVEGTFKRRVRPPADHRTLGPGACSGCHNEQNEWWFGHAHYTAADAFFDQRQENLQIARLYGLSPAQMTRGDQICMECHGTVVSGKESRDVIDGVSCERCHGPAADWLEPHKVEGGPSGANRPGYREALQRGKRDLKELETRTRVCTDCHYVTEPRLLSAGHPSGRDFDYVKGMAEVRHWREPLAGATQLASAIDGALASRGPVPRVRVARVEAGQGSGRGAASASSSSGGSAAAGARPASPTRPTATRAPGSVSARRNPAAYEPSLSAPSVPRTRPVDYVAELPERRQETPIDLPPFPEIDEATSFEDTLLILQERLRLLHSAVRGDER
jgi:hypothetical protein